MFNFKFYFWGPAKITASQIKTLLSLQQNNHIRLISVILLFFYFQMTELHIEPKNIFLSGISLQGKFTIHNPHPQKAITFHISLSQSHLDIFQYDSEERKTNETLNISIFPQQGILLPKRTETIKIRPKLNGYFCDRFQLKVMYTDSNNYNKIKAKTSHILKSKQDWEQETVQVEIGTDYTRIKKQLEEEAHFSSTLGRDTSNISIIKQKNDGSIIGQGNSIVQQLEISSQNSNRRFNSLKDKVITSNLLTSSIKKPYKVGFYESEKKVLQPKVNSIEVLILAMLAGFFFALGSNLGHLFQN